VIELEDNECELVTNLCERLKAAIETLGRLGEVKQGRPLARAYLPTAVSGRS
jgi:hypothetical protein